MKGKLREAILHMGLTLKVILLKLFLDHSCFGNPKGEITNSRNNQFCGMDFSHVVNPSGSLLFTSILHENIYTARVVRLYAEELGNMSKYSISMDCLGIISLTIHLFLVTVNHEP